MLREKRHAEILEILKQDKLVTILDLSQRLQASYMTIWRDLEILEEQGQLQRVRGGAVMVQPPPPGSSAVQVFPAFQNQDSEILQRKRKIGAYAARELVEDGDFLTIEAGTTASSMAPYLNKSGLTVLTNGLFTSAMLFPSVKDIVLMCSGGILIETGAFTGPQVEEFFGKYRVKKTFLGAGGLTLKDGYTDPSPLYMNIKNQMKCMADQVIVLLDSSKFGVRSLVQVLTLNEVNILVTDSAAPPDILAGLRAQGVDVRVAE